MVICRYFLKGICKFGDYCKNEHHLDNYNYQQPTQQSGHSILRQATFNTNTGNNPSTNVFYSAQTQPQPQQQPQKQLSDQDISTIIKVVVNDVNVAEKGGQWRLTCYGPFGDKPCIPGFEDLSFEEVRLSFYEARGNAAAMEQFRQQWQRMLSDANFRFKSLLNPTPELLNILKQIYNHPVGNKITPNTSSNIFATSSNSTSIFAQANQNLFGQSSGSIFSGAQNQNVQQPTQNTNIFAGQNTFSNPSANNIFANANNSIFGNSNSTNVQNNPNNSIFGNVNATNTQNNASNSIFGNSNTTNTQNTIFANVPNQNAALPQQQTPNIFNTGFATKPVENIESAKKETSIFGTGNTASQYSNSIFGQTSATQNSLGVFGQNARQNEPIDESAYSKVEEFNEDELKWFANDNEFDLMKIPEKPPPKEFCL